MKYLFLSLPLLAATLTPLTAATPTAFQFHYDNILGSSLDLKIITESESTANAAAQAALDEIDRVSKIISSYDPNSTYSHWFETTNQPTRIPRELTDLLKLYDTWHETSRGALCAGTQSLYQLWQAAEKNQQLPSPTDLAQAIATTQQPHWSLGPTPNTATHLTQAPLSFNAAGKGFVIQLAAQTALQTPDTQAVIVNDGGDLTTLGNWTETVAITNPLDNADNAAPIARIQIQNQAVATSGNYRRFFTINQKTYSHIIDPRDGLPANQIISATAIAPNAADADALATIFSILDPHESLMLANSLPNVECLLIQPDGSQLHSQGWHTLEIPLTKSQTTPAPANPSTWNPNSELTLELELARPSNARAPRPFVAVWIEDADGFPIRTLALWFNGPRWLPDLRSWYQGDQMRSLVEEANLVDSISSATRSPGKYKLKWDGKDNAGQYVKTGQYTLLIETAREHGTHQLIRQKLNLTNPPLEANLETNIEIANARISYQQNP